MNEETTVPTEEVSDPGTQPATAPDETEAFETQPSSLPADTEAASTGDGTVTEEDNEISETVADIPSEELVLEDGTETTEETVSVVTAEVVQDAAIAVAHADLFGSFLVCGTLIGLFLLRGIHGT